ncbi:hypothetical protein, partial [Corynebacterium sp. HMSC070H05]
APTNYTETATYSQQAVEFIVGYLQKDPEGCLDALKRKAGK